MSYRDFGPCPVIRTGCQIFCGEPECPACWQMGRWRIGWHLRRQHLRSTGLTLLGIGDSAEVAGEGAAVFGGFRLVGVL